MKVINKKVRFNYRLFDKYEAGIALLGGEVKSIRQGKIDLTNSWAKIIGGEIYLVNANIPIEGKKDYDSRRSRKLLLHKNQIVGIITKTKTKKLTIVPTKMYTKGRLVKAEIALAKSKKKFEKKRILKKKDIEREIQQQLKGTT